MNLRGRVLLTVTVLGLGAFLLFGCDGERPKTDEQINAEQIQRATDALSEDAETIGGGVVIYEARTQLTVLGLWDRFDIRGIREAGGNLAILTGLPAGAGSEPQAAEICDALIGGNPPALDLPGKIAVVSGDRRLIRAGACGT
jgi:hypothetical protein